MNGSEHLGRSPIKDRRSSTKSVTPALASNRSKRRATRACDRCKHKKMRCTGKQPCANCLGAGVETACSYTAKYTRGKAPPIQVASHNNQTQWTPGAASIIRRQSSDHSSETSSSEPGDPPLRDREESISQDKEPSTFTSTYHRTQHNLTHSTTHKHKNPVFAYGDQTLPEPDTSYFLLPPLDESRNLVAKFFEIVNPSMRIFHQPTVDKWLLDVLENFRRGQTVDIARSAIVLLILACSYNYRDISSKDEDTNISFRYFQAADDMLGRERGEIRLESVQARLLQCIYLLSRSRINHAWTIFGTAVSQIFAIQLHRKAKIDRNEKKDLIHVECCKRVFWSAYTIDKYMSLCLGRPEYFNDEMIDQELPLMVDDDNLSRTSYVETRNDLHCTMRSSVYQKQMSMILGATLRDLYGVRPQTLEKRLALARKHHNSLKLLAHANSAYLAQDTSNLRILLRQQLFGAKLTYSHHVIVLFRPFLLHNSSADDEINPVLAEEHENNVLECLKAAIEITCYLNAIFEVSQFFSGSWFTHFCGYTAIVALYVYVIKHHSDPEETWMDYFKAAEKCQNQIKVAAEKESFSQKCSQILDELYAEAMSHILRRKRQEEREGISRRQEESQGLNVRSQEPQYSDQFDIPTVSTSPRQPMPEYTYGEQWQNMNFDQTAPGGGILGSMDWIQMQSPSSVVDQIERWGFSSLTGW